MISVKQACENINGLLLVPGTFKYGTPKELNTLGDDITVWPATFLFNLMGTRLEYGRSLGVNNKPQINMLFIDKTEFGEFANESETIRDAQLLRAQNYLNNLSRYRTPDGSKYFNVKPGNFATITFVYDEFDVNVTGVRLEMTIDTMYKDSACI